MAPVESPLLDPVTLEILETAYLQRCATVADLRAALPSPPDDFAARVEALCAGGFLADDGGRLGYTSPYTAFIAIGAVRAERIVDEAARTTALMQALPRLIRAWDISEVEDGGQHPLAVNIIHAVSDSGDAWFRHAAAEPASRPSLVFPAKAPLLAALRAGHLDDLQQVDKQLLREDQRCLWLANHKARFKKVKETGRKCAPPIYRRASGTSAWTYALRKRLPVGKYVLHAQVRLDDGRTAIVRKRFRVKK